MPDARTKERKTPAGVTSMMATQAYHAMDHRISKGNLPNDKREPTEEANVCIYFIVLVDFENNRNEIANGRSSTTQ